MEALLYVDSGFTVRISRRTGDKTSDEQVQKWADGSVSGLEKTVFPFFSFPYPVSGYAPLPRR